MYIGVPEDVTSVLQLIPLCIILSINLSILERVENDKPCQKLK